jgi:hypothetical protein
MRTTRLTTASLATVLSAAVVGAPASALAAGGEASETPVPQAAPTWPVNPQVIPRAHEVTTQSGSGLDWDSAGIGAATVLGAFAIGTAGVAGVRRRRVTRVSLGDH